MCSLFKDVAPVVVSFHSHWGRPATSRSFAIWKDIFDTLTSDKVWKVLHTASNLALSVRDSRLIIWFSTSCGKSMMQVSGICKERKQSDLDMLYGDTWLTHGVWAYVRGQQLPESQMSGLKFHQGFKIALWYMSSEAKLAICVREFALFSLSALYR